MARFTARRTLPGLLALGTLAGMLAPRASEGQTLRLVTVKAQAPDSVTALRGQRVAVSADGRYVAFCSAAPPADLVPGKNVPPGSVATRNVYVRDMVANATEVITLSATDPGTTSDGACLPDVQITPDGRYVAFRSNATNLQSGTWSYPADENSGWIFDRQTRTLALVDVAVQPFHAGGVKEMVMSENGRFVAFSSRGTGSLRQLVANFIDANGELPDLYVRDMQAGVTRLVSRHHTDPNRGSPAGVPTTTSEHPGVFSADGTVLLFAAAFAELVPNGQAARNLYVYRWASNTTTLVSARTGEANFVTGVTVHADDSPGVPSFSLTADGAFAAFAASTTQGDLTAQATNGRRNVYVRDIRTATGPTTLVSLTPAGLGGNGDSLHPVISRGGSVVAFESLATDLLNAFDDTAGLTDVFARPMSGSALAGPAEWLTRDHSVPSGGNQPATLEGVSADGRYVAWRSRATNYVHFSVVADTNAADDVFVRDRVAGTVSVKSVVPIGAPSTADAASGSSTLLASGHTSFFSEATNLLVTPATTGINVFAPAPELADLSLSIADAPDPGLVGKPVVYAFTVANLGPAAATGVALRVPVPDGASTLVAQGGLTPVGGAITFDLGSIAAGATATRTVAVTYGGARVASVSATVTASQADPVAGNDTATQSTVITSAPALPTLTGTVSGPGGGGVPGVALALSGSASDTTISAADGSYVFGNIPVGGTVTVTPSATGYTFSPASASLTDVAGDRTADFTATCAPAISGLVRDRQDGELGGITVALSNGSTVTTLTDASGRYTFTDVTPGQSVTLTPSRPGFTFEPASVTLTTAACGTTPVPFVASSGAYTRYFAEGATGSFFDTSIALLNASGVATTARLTFQTGTGQVVTRDVPLGGLLRTTVNPKTIPGLAAAEFSTVVSSDQPIVADRTMRWNATGYGSHAEASIAEPRTQWYLAEGATTGGFQLFYLLQNPNDVPTDVQVTYLLPAPRSPITKTYPVPARSRQNIWVNVEDAGLASAEMSAVFTAGLPIIVERAMYRDGPGQMFAAGHEAAAVPGPANQWFFAEGATGPYFDLFYLIANTTASAITIDGRYLLPDGTVLTKTYTVPAFSRFNVWADYEEFAGRPGLPLADTAVSATFTGVDGAVFVAERAMWWPGDGSRWFEGHVSSGALRSGTKWALAGGEVGGTRASETYILIANTSNTDGTVLVTLVYEDGSTSVFTRPVKANSRTNVAVASEVPAAANRRFGAIVESLGATPAQIVVERAIYENAGGVTWAAGSNNLGTRLR
ncbi:carboxypeptidase regulatory-like domain-containing protein [Luteitalea sp. TBR-22]|uniref:carboxypeptidase regulatory-like domain-containing protein n=1 Tax=Luteitalea sp. TBR-22 TaxID=2802971 RepID=UPI001EF40547|nr:carboxypeptidase regulatory-like domain-containing protein [Luteitalea sp. TBR-22]